MKESSVILKKSPGPSTRDRDTIDDYDEFGNYIGPNRGAALKEHSSILGKILVIIIAYFLITRVIDPMTQDIDEGEIIGQFGDYPYNKIMDFFRDKPIDSDDDGLADSEEQDGWNIESRVLTLKENDGTRYRFRIDHTGEYLVNMSVRAAPSTSIQWGWGSPIHTITISADTWRVVTLNPTGESKLEGNHTLDLKVIAGNLTIDWISMVSNDLRYAESLDGGDTSQTNGTKTNMLVHVATDPHNPDTDYDGMLDGYEVAVGENIGGWQDPLVSNERYAFLLAGGSTNVNDNYPSIKNDVEYAYEVLHDFYGYKADNIIVLSWDGKVQNKDIVDGPGTLEEIGDAFDHLKEEMGPNDFLFVYVVSHGLPGVIEVYNTPQQHDLFKYEWLMENLTAIQNDGGTSGGGAKRMTVVVEACHSGSCLFDIAGDGIIVIGSTAPEADSYTYSGGYALFTFFFFDALEHPSQATLPSYEDVKNVDLTFEEHKFISVGDAFRISKDNLKIQGITKDDQIPQLDQDGDSIPDVKEEGLAYVTYI
jgi:hypothetical protein